MKKSNLLLACAMLLSVSAFAQAPKHPKYVKEGGEKTPFHQAYRNWEAGTPLYSDVAEDEEFFISRVKPKQRFTNAQTQVDPKMDSRRQLLWWCPAGMANDGAWKALPSYHFDSEVFSMWSYVDIYGHWTAPFIRMEAAFADVCHKNGVRTSVLASVPWASTVKYDDGGHGSNMSAMCDGGSEKLLRFLRYYGIDGIGYNSEFNIGTGLSPYNLKELLSGCFAKREEMKWPTFTNSWYSLMTSGGSVGGTDWLSSGNKDWFNWNNHPTSDGYFMNYNWGADALATSQATATGFGRSSFDVFAGMDFQGRSRADWLALKNADISVGIWGAHNMNMIFEGRGECGSTALAKQKTYQLISENVFTSSAYNPVNNIGISNILRHSTTATNFHGFSKFITARSVLASKNLAKEPFVTYFNLGNGTFFNVEGVRNFDKEWYNIGIQDYLPTWRWWWATGFMANTPDKVPAAGKGMVAEFTWDDAWFGGSCLQISGQTDLEYLHLFKTQYDLKQGDEVTVRYKVLSGSAKAMSLSTSAVGAERSEVAVSIAKDMEYTPKWASKTVKVGTLPFNLQLVDKTMAMMALRFENTTSDFKVLIGELSVTRGTTATPVAPKLVGSKCRMLATNYKGADFKVFYQMKDRDPKNLAEPIYNSDVDTWYFKIYSQQQGGEPVVCTATTSWAAYVVGAPIDLKGELKMRVGVQAVSLDGKTESPITWTNYMDVAAPEVTEGIEIDKPIIKQNEQFTVKFVDPTHPAAQKWEIVDSKTNKVVANVANKESLTATVSNIGLYDLRITTGGKQQLYQGLIQISPDEVGAMPEIKTLTANDSDKPVQVTKGEDVTFAYTSRDADGQVSRGIRLAEIAFGIPCEQLNLNGQSPFSVSFWFCPATFNHGTSGTHFLNIRNSTDGWPKSDWGYIWTEITPDGKYQFCLHKASNAGHEYLGENYVFYPNQWYHMTAVVGWNNGRFIKVFVNGNEIISTSPTNDLTSWSNNNVIMIGGIAFSRAGFDGYLDEVKFYNKALTQDEARKSMNNEDLKSGSLLGYWDFEAEPNSNNECLSVGQNKELVAYVTKIEAVQEGKNRYTPQPITFATGSPFISGSNYKVVTNPTWTMAGYKVVKPASNGKTSGNITVSYPAEGTYDAMLTLANGWASVSKTFRTVTVKGEGTGIEEEDLEAAYNAFPNPFFDNVNVSFAEDGVYGVEVFDLSGRRVNAETVDVTAGENVVLSVNGGAGVYFINITKDGKVMKALKVIKK